MRCNTFVTLFMILLFAGCGYQFAGGGKVPGGVRAVSIAVFENRTGQTGLETIFTNDLIYEFTRADSVNVTTPQAADAVLSGVIQRLYITAIAHTGTTTTTEQRAIVTIDLKLTATSDGAVLWERKGLSGEEAFSVGSTKSATNANQRAALEALFKKMAESSYNTMTADF
ncbi:MAG: LptE family protein [Pseudomonadota bacterium]